MYFTLQPAAALPDVPLETGPVLRKIRLSRHRLVGMHTQTVNRMHSIARRHHLNHDLEKIALDPRYPWGLAGEAELLALRPELP